MKPCSIAMSTTINFGLQRIAPTEWQMMPVSFQQLTRFFCCFFVKFYYWLHWVFDVAHRPFITVCGLSLAAVSRGYCLAVGRGLLLAVAFLVLEHRLLGFSSCSTRTQLLWCMGLTAPLHVESSWTRDWTSVPCADRQILNHCTTRKVPIKHVSSHFI